MGLVSASILASPRLRQVVAAPSIVAAARDSYDQNEMFDAASKKRSDAATITILSIRLLLRRLHGFPI